MNDIQTQRTTSTNFDDGEEILSLLDDSQTSLISNLSDCFDLYDGVKESSASSSSSASPTTRPDVEVPDSPIKAPPPRRPIEEQEEFLGGSHRLPELTDSSSSFTTQPISHPPPRSPHPASASAPAPAPAPAPDHVVEKRQRGILKKERPRRAAALKIRRPSRNESNGSCSIGSLSTALSRSSNNDLSVSSSSQLRIRRPTHQQWRRQSSMNGGSLHQQGGSMHQPFKSIIKKRVTFWDEQSVGTALSMSLHHLCDTGGGSGSASPSPKPRFIDTNFQFGIDYDDEDCDFADDDDDDDGFGDGFDDFEYGAFAFDVEDENEDDYECNLDDNACDDVEQDEVRNENCVDGNVVEQRGESFRRVKLPCVNLDSENGEDDFDEMLPREIKWDHDTSFREHGSSIPWFLKDKNFVIDGDEDDVATRQTSLPTPTPSNQRLSSATNDQVPRLHNEGNFLFYTPSGEEPVPRNDLLHTDQMPEIPKEWSILMPDLDDDDDDDEDDGNNVEEDNEKRSNKVEDFQSDFTKSTPLPSHSVDKVTAKVSPASVLQLNIELGSEEKAQDSHGEDEQIQLCTKLLAKTGIYNDSFSSLTRETDNHHRLSPTSPKWVC